MLNLRLGPVYSCLATEDDLQNLNIGALPASYTLRRHQAQTWQAFEKGEVDVIFDTALTGDGKSLAGQLPMLVDDRCALLLYPTNELIKDQEKQVLRYIKDFGLDRQHQMMYSEKITEEIERSIIKGRSSLIQTWFKNRDCILSNPDLFHLLSSYNYGSNLDKREHIYQIPENIDYIIFDEFHIFGPPQIVSVVNILNYYKIAFPHRRLKYIFLSATPTPMFMALLKNSGFRVAVIEGSYSHIPAAGYTRDPIVQPVNLNIHRLSEKGAYAWAEEHLTEIKDFYRTYSDAKGVFIVNSVATAKRLVAFYKREMAGLIEVGENTGLTNREERGNAMNNPNVQLIIATSTIDVGVDFKINLLIFESANAGTFIQRLGRLGRHTGWSEYRAYALVPDWIGDRFATHFSDGSQIERVQFLKAIREQDEVAVVKDEQVTTIKQPIFQQEQTYKHYVGCWGGLQAAHIIVSAEDWHVGKTGKNDLSRELRQQYNRVYPHRTNKDWIGDQVKRYLAMRQDKEEGQHILAELNSFRGRSPLDCGIYDETDHHFKRYNLFFLLANTRFHPMKEAEFKRMVEARKEDFEKYRSHELKLYVRLERYVEERENFMLASECSFKKELNRVHAYDSFWIEESRALASHLDDSVNERLEELPLVSLVSEGTPQEFKGRNNLNLLFPVYQVKDGDGIARSIVFGLDALLAHTLVFWRAAKNDCDELLIL